MSLARSGSRGRRISQAPEKKTAACTSLLHTTPFITHFLLPSINQSINESQNQPINQPITHYHSLSRAKNAAVPRRALQSINVRHNQRHHNKKKNTAIYRQHHKYPVPGTSMDTTRRLLFGGSNSKINCHLTSSSYGTTAPCLLHVFDKITASQI